MYKNLELKRKTEREYGKKYRARQIELTKARKDEVRRRIAAAIVAMELQREE